MTHLRRHRSAALVLAGVVVAACASCTSGAKPATVTTTTPGGRSTGPSTGPSSTIPGTPTPSADWPTYFHDSARSGLTTGGPASASGAHRLWASAALDGDIYAQPLIVGTTVIAATENDTVYALDATTGAVKWHQHLGTPVAASALPCGNVDPVGITSTPVVDVAARRVYVVGLVQPAHHLLFALDLTSGSVIASVGVDTPGADPTIHNSRAALTLLAGRVLVPFGGRFGDCGDYHGRLAAVGVPANAASGFGPPTWYTLPTQREGGFWAPPGAVVANDGSVLLASGNSASNGTYDYGNSVVHLSAGAAAGQGGVFSLVDSFAPANWAALNDSDADLGSTNPVLVGDNRVFQAGKGGTGYLLAAGHLGGLGGQLAAAPVCSGQAMGGVSHTGTTVFVPCPDGIAAVSVAGDQVAVSWRLRADTPGPAIVTAGAIWTVATGSGVLVAADSGSGRQLFSQPIGSVPSRFTSPAAGGGRVLVAADHKVLVFGD